MTYPSRIGLPCKQPLRFAPGDEVHIFNRKRDGTPIYEGLGTIMSKASIDQYWVKFPHDDEEFLRYAYRGLQHTDPEEYLAGAIKTNDQITKRFNDGRWE